MCSFINKFVQFLKLKYGWLAYDIYYVPSLEYIFIGLSIITYNFHEYNNIPKYTFIFSVIILIRKNKQKKHKKKRFNQAVIFKVD